jgi:hypothetical protein
MYFIVTVPLYTICWLFTHSFCIDDKLIITDGVFWLLWTSVSLTWLVHSMIASPCVWEQFAFMCCLIILWDQAWRSRIVLHVRQSWFAASNLNHLLFSYGSIQRVSSCCLFRARISALLPQMVVRHWTWETGAENKVSTFSWSIRRLFWCLTVNCNTSLVQFLAARIRIWTCCFIQSMKISVSFGLYKYVLVN